MSTSMEQTDSPRLKQRPYSEPNIDEKSQSSPGGLRPELVDAWSQRCAFVVDEILQTERDYVDSLGDVIQGYRVPLVTRLKSSSDTQKLVNTLFGNIDDLHGLHMSLLRKLRAHDTEPHEFGQVFIQTEDGFQLYTGYCTNYNSAMLCLQQLLMSEKHNQFLDQCQRNLKHNLPLSAQLIKPVQRITRYHLLLHDLVKHFNPNHYGYANLKQAHKAMAKIANDINKVKKQEENAKRVEHLQTSLYGWKGNEGNDCLSVYGELILESACHVGVKKTERQVLLFEKLLLILKKKDTKRYNYKAHIVASELGLDDTLSSSNRTCFKIYSKARRHITYTVDPRSTSKRSEWIKSIKDLIRRMAEQYPQDLDEYERLMKRKKLDEVVSGDQRPAMPVPQRVESPARVLSEKTNIALHGRIPSHRKRRRGDVRDLFEQDKDVQLVNIRRAVTDETMYQVPQPQQQLESIPAMVCEPTSEEGVEEPMAAIPLGKRAESMESLLSLSDVEVGMEEHARDLDDIDYHKRKIKRRKTDLKRRQAIKVKKSPSNQSLNASIKTRIRRKAKEAKQDVEGDHYLTSDRKDSVSEDETELAKLMGPLDPAHLMDSSIDQDSLFDSSMDSSTLGQSVGGGGIVGVAEGDVGAQVAAKLGDFPSGRATAELENEPHPDSTVGLAMEQGAASMDSVFDSGVQSDGVSLSSLRTGPPVEIIQDYREDGGIDETKHETIEEESAFAKVIEDAGIGDSPIPDTVAVLMDDDTRGDILIVEDSSTDSEDEEEEDEGMGLSYSAEYDDRLSPVGTIPPPPAFAGDQEVPDGDTDIEQQQEWDSSELDKSFHTQEQLSDFFTNLSREATPDLENADVSTTGQVQPTPSSSEQLPIHQETMPYLFQGDKDNLSASPALERVKDAEIYATMPRKKPRSKVGSPATTSPCVTPLGHQASKKQFSSSAQTQSRSAARRAEGFSELLQFTRQQQFTSPLSDMDVSQSLPSFTRGSVSTQETVLPLVYNLTENSVGLNTSREEQVGSGLPVSEPNTSDREEKQSKETLNVVFAAPKFAISPPPEHNDDDEETNDASPSTERTEEIRINTENGLRDSEETANVLVTSQESAIPSLPDHSDEEINDFKKQEVVNPLTENESVLQDSEETANVLVTSQESAISSPLDHNDEKVNDSTKCEDVDPSTENESGLQDSEGTANVLVTSQESAIPSPLDQNDEKVNDSTKCEDVNPSTENESGLQDSDKIANVLVTSQESAIPFPLDHRDKRVNDSTKCEDVNPSTENESGLQDSDKTANVLLACEVPEFATSTSPNHNGEEDSTKHKDVIATAETREVSDEEKDISSQTVISEEVKTSTESVLHDPSTTDDHENKTITVTVDDEMADKTETNGLQQNGSYRLRHRTGERHQEEQKRDPVVADTASSDISREEREDSTERSIDSHSVLSQQVSVTSQTRGVFGWFQRIIRRSLFGLLPSLGLRGGLLVAGVAAISSVVIYNLSGHGQRGSSGVGDD